MHVPFHYMLAPQGLFLSLLLGSRYEECVGPSLYAAVPFCGRPSRFVSSATPSAGVGGAKSEKARAGCLVSPLTLSPPDRAELLWATSTQHPLPLPSLPSQ